jgi:hypothetical protein
MYDIILPIHVVAGGLAIVLGAVALAVKKGGMIHRRSGLRFVYAMLVMGISASILEFLESAAATNLVAALLALYFVGTALTTARPVSRWTRIINVAALSVAVGLALMLIVGGVKALDSSLLSPGGVPFRTIGVMSLILAAFLLLAAAGDVRIMRFGPPRGGPRLGRHLWRMCFALFIAAGCSGEGGDNPSGAVHDRPGARAADRAAVRRDVLWAVEGPRPPHVASGRSTRCRRSSQNVGL